MQTEIRELGQRLEDISTELALANQELSDLRQAEVEKRQQFEDERGVLQSQINNLNEDAEKNAAALTFYQEDLRSQARIAQESQQNYERELVKHAEAAKALQQLREEHSNLKAEVHQIQAEAETAKTTLGASESSWDTQKENYEKELEEIKKRCDGLVKQNKILLDQLDNVNAQVSIIQKNRTTMDEGDEFADQPTTDRGIEDIKEVLRYLRNEKEIVDVQYELALQEGKRLKQQLDYTKSALDETRLLLAQERQRESDQLRGAMQHKDLMEKISELNLLRESNSALRNDGEKKGKKVSALNLKVEELVAKLEPLEGIFIPFLGDRKPETDSW
jgi:nucleoprotein TPR